MIKIQKLLFPNTIAGHRIFSERFLGIFIDEKIVKAVVIKKTGSKKIIEKLIELNFPDTIIIDTEGNVNEVELGEALAKIYKQAGSVDKIIMNLPANLFVFKEMIIPFSEDEKIRLVLNYEAEPLLPFSADSYVLDFIKDTSSTTGPCKIMVCATQKNVLNSLKNVILKTGIKPDNLIIDLVSLYDLCNQLEQKNSVRENYAIISISEKWTKVGFIDNGFLRFIKNIPTGTLAITEELSTKANISKEDAKIIVASELNALVGSESAQEQFRTILLDLSTKVQFALQAFNSKTENITFLEKIIIFEESTAIPAFSTICQQLTNISCQAFSVEKMLAQDKIVNRASYRASSIYSNLIALSSATISESIEKFDLGRNLLSRPSRELVQQQLTATFVITVLIFLYIFLSASFKNSHINNLIAEIEQSIKEKVIKTLLPIDIKLPKKPTLKKLLAEAINYTESVKSSWQIHGPEDLKPLEVMLDFTRLLDRSKVNINATSLKMFYNEEANKIIELKGSFKKGANEQDFKKLVTQISNIKKFSNIKVNEERLPDIVQFYIQVELEA